ncbi:MAG: helix-turn-helix domain-containing protein [Bacteroidota bacterium]
MNNATYLKELGKRLRENRKLKKMSMKELADNCNIDKSTVYRIEKGLMNPTILMLKALCGELGVDLKDFLE